MQQCPPQEMPAKLIENVSDKAQENLINMKDLNENDNYI